MKLEKNKKSILISLDVELIQRLDAFRILKNVTRSHLIEFILSEYFKKETEK
jgi:metal-responsive CopG/Arc/MetJ family transcriptional regulator